MPCLPVTMAEDGGRVDRVLGVLQPGHGLRGRRRLCLSGRVLLDGRPVGPAVRVRVGQTLVLLPETEAGTKAETEAPRLIHAENGLAALYKPVGLHSAALAGGGGKSLEARLRTLLKTLPEPLPAPDGEPDRAFPVLLNRLDAGTSGLVLAALDAEGKQRWHGAAAGGDVDKRYLALISGHPANDFTVRGKIDAARRRRVRVLHREGEALRHTFVQILFRFDPAQSLALAAAAGLPPDAHPLTLAGCRIRSGSRHQIRAHLAFAGYPLWGDAQYGKGSGSFFLHHGLCALPGFSARCLPAWETLLPPQAVPPLRDWLSQ